MRLLAASLLVASTICCETQYWAGGKARSTRFPASTPSPFSITLAPRAAHLCSSRHASRTSRVHRQSHLVEHNPEKALLGRTRRAPRSAALLRDAKLFSFPPLFQSVPHSHRLATVVLEPRAKSIVSWKTEATRDADNETGAQCVCRRETFFISSASTLAEL